MRFAIVIISASMAFHLPAKGQEEAAIHALVNKLGSANFKERAHATEALKERPEAAPALREAVRSADKEVARRAAEILEHFQLADLREVSQLVKEGRIHRAIEVLARSSPGRNDKEIWQASRELATAILRQHEKLGGKKLPIAELWSESPVLVYEKATVAKLDFLDQFLREGHYFARADKVDVDFSKGIRERQLPGLFVVAHESVRLQWMLASRMTILAGGSVDLSNQISQTLIVSGGDVTLLADVTNSLIIARGNVKLTRGQLYNCRIICGKSLIVNEKLAKRLVQECIVSENDANPLGFIRWSDPPKDKAVPKGK